MGRYGDELFKEMEVDGTAHHRQTLHKTPACQLHIRKLTIYQCTEITFETVHRSFSSLVFLKSRMKFPYILREAIQFSILSQQQARMKSKSLFLDIFCCVKDEDVLSICKNPFSDATSKSHYLEAR